MTDVMPLPLVEADVDLRDFAFMPLDVERLRRSRSWRIVARKSPELGFYMMNLWCASWHERPAGSLEDDDDLLADLAMCSPRRWPQVRDIVLQGWVKCQDGRRYHPVVCEKVLEAWTRKKQQSLRGKSGAVARWQEPIDIPTPKNAYAIAEAMPEQSLSNGSADAKGLLSDGNRQDKTEKGQRQEESVSSLRSETVPPLAKTGGLVEGEYAFSGRLIRLKQADFDAWQRAYHGIPDIRAKLETLDSFYDRTLEGTNRRKWFYRCASALQKEHDAIIAARKNSHGRNDGFGSPGFA